MTNVLKFPLKLRFLESDRNPLEIPPLPRTSNVVLIFSKRADGTYAPAWTMGEPEQIRGQS